jgi:magnesium-transporting ATPase (P-type)
MRTNSFTAKMSKKSNEELETIFDEKSKYTEEAVQAVIWELENRSLLEKTEILYQDPEKVVEVTTVSNTKETQEKNESPFEELVLPVLYSKKAIQGFTIFFTTIFGAVLLMRNLKEMNKPKAGIQVLVFGIVYTLFSIILLNYLPKMFFITLIFNLIGYAVLSEFFWNKNLGKELTYNKKKIWKPLFISTLILFLVVFLQFLPQILEM